MMEQLETGNIGIGNTSTLATLNSDRFIIVDQKKSSGKCAEETHMRFAGKIRRKPNPKGAQASAARRSRTFVASALSSRNLIRAKSAVLRGRRSRRA